MKIKMMNKHGHNAVQNALVDALLSDNKSVNFSKLFVYFEVDDWHAFLSLLWKSYAAASRQSDGDAMRSRYRISVTMENGKDYYTDVWYVGEEKCICYASLR